MNNFEEMIAGNQLTLVDFFATWCGPCRSMHPILDQLKTDMKNQIVILKIDVDKNPTLTHSFSVQSIPTLMLFRNGQLFWRQSGALTLNRLKAVIHEHQ